MEDKPTTRKAMREAIALHPVKRSEIRYFVDLYYQLQEYRKAGGNQERAAIASDEPPGEFSRSVQAGFAKTETGIERYLDELTSQTTVGRWAKSVVGIGPVISAGLLAHIDIRQAPTAGRIWRFAGLDPTQHWIGAAKAKARVDELLSGGAPLETAIPPMAVEIGCRPETILRLATSNREGQPIEPTRATLAKACAKRPWNAALKVLCWKIGEAFVKTCNNEGGFYGQIYKARKLIEEAKNGRGDFAPQAAAALEAKRFGKTTEAYKAYSAGKLPPAHIHARAKRVAVKLFLAHWQEVAWFAEFGELPPKPYAIDRLGHSDLLIPPNSETVPGLAEAHGR